MSDSLPTKTATRPGWYASSARIVAHYFDNTGRSSCGFWQLTTLDVPAKDARRCGLCKEKRV